MRSISDQITEYARKRYTENTKPSKNWLAKQRLIVELAGKGNDILDIGCGDGSLTEPLKKDNRVWGVDLNFGNIRVDLQTGNLPFNDKSFGVVIASEIIEHIWDNRRLLKEIRRVLVPQGKLIISTPNLASLGRRFLLLRGQNPFVENFLYPDEAGHVKHYTIKDFSYLLTSCGYSISKILSDVVMLPWGFFSISLARRFPSLGRSMVFVCVS